MLIVSTSPDNPAAGLCWHNLGPGQGDSTFNRKYGGQIVGMLWSAGGRNKLFYIVKEWIADADAVVNFL